MVDAKTMQAVARIERALGRIEGSAAAEQAAPRDDGALDALRETHVALRGSVEGAIAQLERLLDTGKAR